MIAFIADAQKLDSADGEILLARHGTNGPKAKAKNLKTVFSLKYRVFFLTPLKSSKYKKVNLD